MAATRLFSTFRHNPASIPRFIRPYVPGFFRLLLTTQIREGGGGGGTSKEHMGTCNLCEIAYPGSLVLIREQARVSGLTRCGCSSFFLAACPLRKTERETTATQTLAAQARLHCQSPGSGTESAAFQVFLRLRGPRTPPDLATLLGAARPRMKDLAQRFW